nr:hypothetical protein [Nesterenkonia sp. GX14115]
MNEIPRHRRPQMKDSDFFDAREGGADPAFISQAAQDSAHALVDRGRQSDDPEITERFVRLAETEGIEAIAELWQDSPPRSLAGSLWRIFAVRSAVQKDPERMAEYFRLGRGNTTTAAIAGVPEPPDSDEMLHLADRVLAGMYVGEIDVAFDRAAAFCRVIARGQTLANGTDSTDLITAATDLEASAQAYRAGRLD